MPVNYLSVSDVTQRKGVTRSAVYQAIASGRLPSERIAGHIVLREKDVNGWEPLTAEKRKGLRVGGRPTKEDTAPTRPRGRPKKQSAGVSAAGLNAPETGAQGQERAGRE